MPEHDRPREAFPEEVPSFLAGGRPVRVTLGDRLLTARRDGRTLVVLRREGDERLALAEANPDRAEAGAGLAAALEACFGREPARDAIGLDLAADPGLADHAVRTGLAVPGDAGLVARSALTMQRRDNWMAQAALPPYPPDHVMSAGRRHPRRPAKPDGLVYARFIPWLGRTLTFRALGLDDLPLFHRWMNDPRVAGFWNEAGTIDAHAAYLSGLLADPHMLPMIGAFDDAPFAYFEIYWAKENRIAPFYDADDYDRGWHVAVGEEAFRGRAYLSAWLPSLMHCLFLDDPRTGRIVGEPAAGHVQQIRNLEVSGFARLKNFDFPHKRASLVMLSRERFFGEALWRPVPKAAPGAAPRGEAR